MYFSSFLQENSFFLQSQLLDKKLQAHTCPLCILPVEIRGHTVDGGCYINDFSQLGFVFYVEESIEIRNGLA
jgi:hypothetical protein